MHKKIENPIMILYYYNMSRVRTYPSIEHGDEDTTTLNSDTHKGDVIIQEKIDGSQLSICNIDGKLHFYNKNKEITATSKPFLNSYLSLVDKPHLFKKGYIYHGEAMNSIQPNTIRYEREPLYFWIIYEIVKDDGISLSPEQVLECIKDTGLEYIRPIFYNFICAKYYDYVQIANKCITEINEGKIKSVLGGKPEGVVLKALNHKKENGKIVNTRYKFVRTEFSEMNRMRKKKLPTLLDTEIVDGIGDVYNVHARFQKAVQHLKEADKWKDGDIMRNQSAMVNELDIDLLKECKEDIKTMLFIRFFPQICKAARSDLTKFLKNDCL